MCSYISCPSCLSSIFLFPLWLCLWLSQSVSSFFYMFHFHITKIQSINTTFALYFWCFWRTVKLMDTCICTTIFPRFLCWTFPLITSQYYETTSIDFNFLYSTTSYVVFQYFTNNGIFLTTLISMGTCDHRHMMVTPFLLMSWFDNDLDTWPTRFFICVF